GFSPPTRGSWRTAPRGSVPCPLCGAPPSAATNRGCGSPSSWAFPRARVFDYVPFSLARLSHTARPSQGPAPASTRVKGREIRTSPKAGKWLVSGQWGVKKEYPVLSTPYSLPTAHSPRSTVPLLHRVPKPRPAAAKKSQIFAYKKNWTGYTE